MTVNYKGRKHLLKLSVEEDICWYCMSEFEDKEKIGEAIEEHLMNKK